MQGLGIDWFQFLADWCVSPPILPSQAGLFMLPSRIWNSLEGGLIASFGMEGKSVVMLTEEARYEDGVIQEHIVEKFVKYFRSAS